MQTESRKSLGRFEQSSGLTLASLTLLVLTAVAGCRPVANITDTPVVVPRNLDGELFCAPPERALILVDQRLYDHIYNELRAWAQAACLRRGIGIRIIGIDGLDDMAPADVRAQLIQYRTTFPAMDGVVMVGNVPMPTFFMSRLDLPHTAYWPRYYQDLDMTPQKTITDGTVLNDCTGSVDADGYPSDWPCMVSGMVATPYTVPDHDFDDFDQGPNPGLEIWASFLPVGYGDPAQDTYPNWGTQLKPFLAKAAAYHTDPSAFYRNLYHVGNDLAAARQMQKVWDEVGPEAIDYYAINTLGANQCDGNSACYVRAPMDDYASLAEFITYAEGLEWMGEGWQDPAVFISHMNNNAAFPRRVVWWAVHSSPDHSLISADQARNDINPGRGGALALLNGCLVGSYQRPGHTLPADPFAKPYPHGNVLVSLVYGNGAFIAALGSVPPRAELGRYGEILDRIYQDGYLGQADRGRIGVSDNAENTPWGWRRHWDILIGDPFIDAYQCPDGPGSCGAQLPPDGCPDGAGYYCGGPQNLDPDTLYYCLNGTFTPHAQCTAGCLVAPPGDPDECNPAGACPNGQGWFCGDPALSQDTDTLYFCQDGNFSVVEYCADGCVVAPSGDPDYCQGPTATCPSGDGLYCGVAALGQDMSTLYYCQNGSYSVHEYCANGCVVAPPGNPDHCQSVTATCPSGDGRYCGDPALGQDPDILYDCVNGSYTLVEVCVAGCYVAPPGQADYCNAQTGPCPSGNGLYCGDPALGQSASILYNCSNGSYTVYEHCNTTCHVAPPGQADYCDATGTCPSGDGLYCGGPAGLDSLVLYYCTSGNYRVQEYCPNGCYVAPPGQADSCQ